MSKIAVLTSRFPYPLEKGDKLRIYNQIKGLSLSHEVHLITLNEQEITAQQHEALSPYCKSQHVFRIGKLQQGLNLISALFRDIPMQVRLFYTHAIHKKIKKLLGEIEPDAVLCHLIRMSEYVREEKHLNKTLDYMDAFSVGMKKRAEVSNPFLKQLLLLEHRRLVRYERKVFDMMEKKIIISAQDRDAIEHSDRSKIHIVPNGVDFTEFYPKEVKKKYDLLFTGNMGYPPNIESAYFAATRILPLIHKINPEITLLIAGVNPPQKIKKLANKRIIVIEKFDHISDAFSQASVMLAPMMISIGLQNKILQAMAMKVPCIVSGLANNAIGAENNKEILEANTAEEFAVCWENLTKDKLKYDMITDNAFHFVKKNFDWKFQNEKLKKIILA